MEVNYLLTAAGKLHSSQLLLVIAFKGGREVGEDVGAVWGESFDV